MFGNPLQKNPTEACRPSAFRFPAAKRFEAGSAGPTGRQGALSFPVSPIWIGRNGPFQFVSRKNRPGFSGKAWFEKASAPRSSTRKNAGFPTGRLKMPASIPFHRENV
ncbi:MAG: hypothetical protein BAA00_13410 [Parageobacillus thermoglucosidasius]|nr:MAG: hypothetical protein BAA00_13410 [Parageobacillus thermoglucosidasius]